MLSLELDQELEARLLEAARREHQTPTQIINQLLDQYLNRGQASNLLTDIAQELPVIKAFSENDPLSLQQEMRDEWQ